MNSDIRPPNSDPDPAASGPSFSNQTPDPPENPLPNVPAPANDPAPSEKQNEGGQDLGQPKDLGVDAPKDSSAGQGLQPPSFESAPDAGPDKQELPVEPADEEAKIESPAEVSKTEEEAGAKEFTATAETQEKPAEKPAESKLASEEAGQVRVDPRITTATKTAVILLVLFILSSLFIFGLTFVIKNSISKEATKEQELNDSLKAYQKFEQGAKIVDEAVKNLKSISESRLYWSRFFQEINAKTAKYFEFRSLSLAIGEGVDVEQKLQIEGFVPDFEKASRAVVALKSSPRLSDAELVSAVLVEFGEGETKVSLSVSATLAQDAFSKTISSQK